MAKPKKAKVPWARRIITTSALILILVGLVYGLVAGARHLGALMKEHKQTTAEATIAAPVEIPECEPKDINFSLNAAPTVAQMGEPVEVLMEVKNIGQEPCSLNSGDIILELEGDGEVFWQPIQCDEEWGIPLLLAPNQPWSTTLKWDGETKKDCQSLTVEWNEERGVEWFETHQMLPGTGTFKLVAKLPGGEKTETPLVIN